MASDKIINLDKDSFQKLVSSSPVPVLVDFWAEWCGPCKMIGPSLDQIADELAGKVTIAKLNVDDNRDVAVSAGIRSIPALHIYKGGQLLDQKVGALPKQQLKDWIVSKL